MKIRLWLLSLSLSLLSCSVLASVPEIAPFSDQPRLRDLHQPAWFKASFLNLREDLQEAKNAGKIGLLLYFGQANCVYCQKLLEVNFNQHQDIADYTQRYFDVIALDIWGNLRVTWFDGQIATEREWADHLETQFTPSLLFIDSNGQVIFRLRGYYPPYWFRAALDFVVSGYYREETFSQYQQRAAPPMKFEDEELNPHPAFSSPPYWLDRTQHPATRPLVVFFEQNDCHACDILHSGPLQDTGLTQDLERMEVVQLNRWGDTPLITPDGQRTTARAWGDALDIFYTPTMLFFDEQGKLILRVESVVQQYRLHKILLYVLSGDYRRESFQRWHTRQRREQSAQ